MMKSEELITCQKISQNKSFVMTETESSNACADELHWHTSIEFIYVCQGTLSLQLDSNTYTLNASDIVFIASARNHALAYHPNTRVLSLKISAIWIHYTIPDFFQEDLVLCSPDIEDFEDRENVEQFTRTFLLLKDIFYSDGIYNEIGINGYVFILLYQLVSNFRKNNTVSAKYKYDIRLKQTIQYLHSHYKEEIHLQDIADMLFVTPQYISQLFHKYYSITYKQYLTKIRLEHAVYEMIHTKESFIDIALNCGFSSQHSFIDAFKKRYHMTPTQFKEKVSRLEN